MLNQVQHDILAVIARRCEAPMRAISNYTEQRNMQKALKKAGGLKFRTILIPKA
jgi:hypothetical protein